MMVVSKVLKTVSPLAGSVSKGALKIASPIRPAAKGAFKMVAPLTGSVSKVVAPIVAPLAGSVSTGALKVVAPFVPLVGSAYGLGKTCIRVYNATTPTKAVIEGVKGIIIDCSPPIIRYPLLCAGALACGGCAIATGDPNFGIGALECCAAIVAHE